MFVVQDRSLAASSNTAKLREARNSSTACGARATAISSILQPARSSCAAGPGRQTEGEGERNCVFCDVCSSWRAGQLPAAGAPRALVLVSSAIKQHYMSCRSPHRSAGGDKPASCKWRQIKVIGLSGQMRALALIQHASTIRLHMYDSLMAPELSNGAGAE